MINNLIISIILWYLVLKCTYLPRPGLDQCWVGIKVGTKPQRLSKQFIFYYRGAQIFKELELNHKCGIY